MEEKRRKKAVRVEINQRVHIVNALSSNEDHPGLAPRPHVPKGKRKPQLSRGQCSACCSCQESKKDAAYGSNPGEPRGIY